MAELIFRNVVNCENGVSINMSKQIVMWDAQAKTISRDVKQNIRRQTKGARKKA